MQQVLKIAFASVEKNKKRPKRLLARAFDASRLKKNNDLLTKNFECGKTYSSGTIKLSSAML